MDVAVLMYRICIDVLLNAEVKVRRVAEGQSPDACPLLRQALDLWAEIDWGQQLTPQLLSRFLERNVRIPREDTSEVFAGAVLPAVEGILQGVHGRDKRFSASFLRCGSYIEGLKVSEPNEFDFLVPLQGLPALGLSPELQKYLPEPPRNGASVPVLFTRDSSWATDDVSLALSPPEQIPDPLLLWLISCWISRMRVLSPDRVMATFHKLVCDVTKSTPGSIAVYPRTRKSPAVTVKINSNEMEIDVDLVPVIKEPYQSWTFNWPRPGQSWPSQAKIQKVKEMGVDLVAKHEYYWRYSFSHIERVLFEAIDEDGGQRRNSLRILKKVREDLWKPRFGKVLVSYHLKTVLFWACEIYPYSNDWQNLAESFRRLVNLLLFFLLIGHLPHYFLSKDVNLLKAPKEDLNAVCGEVLTFQAKAMNYFS